MSSSNQSWEKLLAAARRAPARDESAPFGFSTRIAARAFDASAQGSPFARAALRGLLLSGVLAAVAVAANLSAIMAAFGDEPALATDDPVAEVVDIGS